MGKRLPGMRGIPTMRVELQLRLLHVCRCSADKVLALRRDFNAAELTSALKVPWDLLIAANPEGFADLSAGTRISLGKQACVKFSSYLLI